jgi:hypothetical protein
LLGCAFTGTLSYRIRHPVLIPSTHAIHRSAVESETIGLQRCAGILSR